MEVPQVTISQFKVLSAAEIRELKSFEVVVDGKYLCTVIIPRTGFIRDSVHELSILSNSVGGRDPSSSSGQIPLEKEATRASK